MRPCRQTQRQRASALIIVLWVVALLSFLIITALMVAMQDAETVGARKVVFRAKQLAEMGVAVASHPLVKPSDPILRNRISATESYEAIITSEEARLNLNAMLTEERSPILVELFGRWGLDPAPAQALTAALIDWTDADDLKIRPDSAEELDYRAAGVEDRPFNRPFQNLEEAMMVAGMDVLMEARPDWRDWFTLRGNGQLDVNEASAEMISLVTGAPAHLAEALVQQRTGPDKIPHTEDDLPLQSIEEALAILGLAGEDAAAMGQLLTVKGTTLRIVSIGRAGDLARGIAVVLRKEGAQPKILEWREFVVE